MLRIEVPPTASQKAKGRPRTGQAPWRMPPRAPALLPYLL